MGKIGANWEVWRLGVDARPYRVATRTGSASVESGRCGVYVKKSALRDRKDDGKIEEV